MQLCARTYYKKQGDEAAVSIKVYLWDLKGRKYFEALGYTQEIPEDMEE